MDTQRFIELCKSGDEQALGLLYTRYAPKMKRLCQRYVQDERVAEDILHDGFIIIMSSIHQLSDNAKLERWMMTIMRNLALRYARRKGRALLVPIDEIEDSEDFAANSTSIVSDYKELLRIVDSLPEGYKQVFKLSVFEDMSHAEIGDMLGINAHSSSSQLARAKKILRTLAIKYGFIFIFIIALISILHSDLFTLKERNGRRRAKKVIAPNVAMDGGEKAKRRAAKPKTTIEEVAPIVTYTAMTNQEVVTEDSLPLQKTDTIRQIGTHLAENEKEERRHLTTQHDVSINYDTPNKQRNSAFDLSLSYSGASEANSSSVVERQLPNPDVTSDVDNKLEKVETKAHHHTPFVVSLSLRKILNSHWGIGTGVRYTRMKTDFTTISSQEMTVTTHTIQYIGVPLTVSYNLWRSGNFSLYTSVGIAADIPVKSDETVTSYGNKQTSVNLSPQTQWSLSVGTGLQYQLTPTISVFAEPNMNYYINSSHGATTIWTDRPFCITIPFGLRLTW